MVDLNKNYSRRLLIRLVVLLVVALLVISSVFNEISAIYFDNQITATGIIINGAIITLFTLGILKIIWILLRYQKEESSLMAFVHKMAWPAALPRDLCLPPT